MKSIPQKVSILLKNNIQNLPTPSVFYSWIIAMLGRAACLEPQEIFSGTSHNIVFFQTLETLSLQEPDFIDEMKFYYTF